MANMFSGKTTKQIPTSLNECRQEDATVNNLHKWAVRLEAWGKALFWILIFSGIILAFVTSIESTEVVYGTYYQWTETETSFDASLFFMAIAKAVLYAFLEYCAYHVLALLISALASITQNTIISANVALYEASQNCASPTSTEAASGGVQYVNQGPAPDGMWLCYHCGTHNSINYGQCKKCGKYKS